MDLRPHINNFSRRLVEIETALSDPKVFASNQRFQELSKEYARLKELVACGSTYLKTVAHLEDNRALLRSEPGDSEFAQLAREEIGWLEREERRLALEVQRGLLPPNPADSRNTIVEIRAGAGGSESALFAAVLYPMYSRMSVGPRAELRMVIAKALSLLTIVGGAVVLIFVLCADQIVGILYSADAYSPATSALRLLAPGLFLLYLNSVIGYALFALGREKHLLAMATAFAFLNVGANLIAIPRFAQDGAAAVTTLTELGLLMWTIRITPRDLLTGESVRTVAKAAVAAVAAGLMVLLSGATTLAQVAG